MRTSESGILAVGTGHRPQAPPKGKHDAQLSVVLPLANLGSLKRLRSSSLRFLLAGCSDPRTGPAADRLVGLERSVRARGESFVVAPIPLCSCGVLPQRSGFSQAGSDNLAPLAFLVATPETGSTASALTYGADRPGHDLCSPRRRGGQRRFCRRSCRHESFGAPPRSKATGRRRRSQTLGRATAMFITHGDPGGHDHAHRHDHHDDDVRANPLPERAPADVVDTTRRIIRSRASSELLDDVSWWLVLGDRSVLWSPSAQFQRRLFDGTWGGGGIASMC